ncbi:NnrS family protein [Pseudothauera nasutitermitis]|uniref:NnrS family protein n=1 Tax=Pseudothauera nasutitermitis TaxID=2565930 RepID=A0A4S4AXC4_9RHOO|nr:NnrS family protein [Pseudothauera nasutitermitis]THF64742.1 NnrS family protein [Pseudothauera nasutitermitis]
MLSAARWRVGLEALLLCGFRPFFLVAAAWGALALAVWLAALSGAPLLSWVPGGLLLWHAHEMVLGFGVAALLGFLLTAVPEFTGSAAVPRGWTAALSALWLVARIGGLFGGAPGAWLVALAETTLLAGALAVAAPRLWGDPERRHLAFLWGLAALLGCVLGYHAAVLGGGAPLPWLYAAVGVLMALIVVALSRISMRVVNAALEERGDGAQEYLARPPRRNLAIFCIALHTAVELAGATLGAPAAPVAGWIALAAAAALFNLGNDWHLGRVLFARWVLPLYLVYVLMALGYLLLGAASLGFALPLSAGRHVLMVGGMGLSIYVVLNIAGRIHAGVQPESGPWVPWAVALLVTATVLRAAAGFAPGWAPVLWVASGGLWIGVFTVHFARAWPLLSRPRADGQSGCAGVAEDAPAAR